MAVTSEQEETHESEDSRVARWVIDRFVEAGFTLGDAMRLAGAHADHHAVERDLRGGCPVETAVRIYT